MIHRFASQPHYLAHIDPVWEALPEELRGESWAARPHKWGRPLPPRQRRPEGLALVAGYADARRLAPAPCVYVEHGAGQSYDGDPKGKSHPCYSGGRGLQNVRVFLAPNERVADRWRRAYPDAAVEVVGCPRLDRYHRQDGGFGGHLQGLPLSAATRPTVALTFHWDAPVCPEARSAWPHYDAALPALVAAARANGWRLLGHGHPRIWPRLRARWAELGIEHTADPDRVLAEADLLVADNTSLMFEAAAVGIPIVVLNAPWYRRDVCHGLRFWDAGDVGLQVDEPSELVATVARALADPPEAADARSRVVMQIYPVLDGRASERAADAIRRAAEEARTWATPRRHAG